MLHAPDLHVVWAQRPSDTPDFRATSNPFATKTKFAERTTSVLAERIASQFANAQLSLVTGAFAIKALLTPAEILTIARWPAVERIYAGGTTVLLAPSWYDTAHFAPAHAWRDGTGAGVGIVEDGFFGTGLPGQLPPVTVVKDGGSSADDPMHYL